MKFFTALCLTALFTGSIYAQAPQPGSIPSPFLFVKIGGPGSTKVTYYPGTTAAFTAADGMTMALRPGYAYRMELNGIPELPGTSLFPSFEVMGSLHVPQGMDVSKHPVSIRFTEKDLKDAVGGKLITKVYYLENPEKAVNLASQADAPLEFNSATEIEAIKEAREKGRPVLIVRVGERPYLPEELRFENVPGTVWSPGTTPVPTPTIAPRFWPTSIPMYDPTIGPKISNFECLHDGGDLNTPLGIGANNKLFGLDPSDTAIEYTDVKGRKVKTSNRVCICVPRFIALRSATMPEGNLTVQGPRINNLLNGTTQVQLKQPALVAAKIDQLKGAIGSLRASAQIAQVGPHAFDHMARAIIVGNVKGVKVVSEATEPEDLTFFPNCTLMLQKRVEPRMPEKIGEEVTFSLRYYNPTMEPISDVVVSDSLSGRLEYIPESAKTDRAMTLTIAPNEAGSVALKWTLTDRLMPGQSGVITFKAKIR